MAAPSIGVIILCVVCLSIVSAIIFIATFGSPSTLIRFCIPRESLPPSPATNDQEHSSFFSRIFSKCFSNWSCFGYVFDVKSYREQIRRRRANEERILVDEQIRRLEQLAEMEMQLREQIANGDTDRATAVQLSRVQRFRYGLAVRTREERRRRRLVRMREWVEADEEQAAVEEEEAHFKNTLSLDEKRRILERVLEFHRHKTVHDCGSVDKPNSSNSNSNSNIINMKNQTRGIAVVSGSSISRISEKSSTSFDDERGSLNGGDENDVLAQNRTCAICLDEYEDGELLAMRTEGCLHMFHKDCLEQWLIARRADCCPVCRSSILTEDEWRDTHLQIISENAASPRGKEEEEGKRQANGRRGDGIEPTSTNNC